MLNFSQKSIQYMYLPIYVILGETRLKRASFNMLNAHYTVANYCKINIRGEQKKTKEARFCLLYPIKLMNSIYGKFRKVRKER